MNFLNYMKILETIHEKLFQELTPKFSQFLINCVGSYYKSMEYFAEQNKLPNKYDDETQILQVISDGSTNDQTEEDEFLFPALDEEQQRTIVQNVNTLIIYLIFQQSFRNCISFIRTPENFLNKMTADKELKRKKIFRQNQIISVIDDVYYISERDSSAGEIANRLFTSFLTSCFKVLGSDYSTIGAVELITNKPDVLANKAELECDMLIEMFFGQLGSTLLKLVALNEDLKIPVSQSELKMNVFSILINLVNSLRAFQGKCKNAFGISVSSFMKNSNKIVEIDAAFKWKIKSDLTLFGFLKELDAIKYSGEVDDLFKKQYALFVSKFDMKIDELIEKLEDFYLNAGIFIMQNYDFENLYNANLSDNSQEVKPESNGM